jgi:hypothetical protein
MSQESFRLDKLLRVDVNVNGKTEQNPGRRAVFKESVTKRKRESVRERRDNRSPDFPPHSRSRGYPYLPLANLPLEENSPGHLFVILSAFHGLPRIDDIANGSEGERLNHGCRSGSEAAVLRRTARGFEKSVLEIVQTVPGRLVDRSLRSCTGKPAS